MAGKRDELLDRYEDRRGRSHRIVLRGRLVLDLQRGTTPRVVAELAEDEGADQGLALLHGRGGYIERAKASVKPLCRALDIDDLRRRQLRREDSAREREQRRLAA